MEIGKINTLKVLRETDIAYLLTDGENEIFLHKKEAKKPYLDNEEIKVFLYSDNLGRITASTKAPLLQLDEVKRLKVVNVKPRYGVFLDIGIVKDLLLSLDDLPEDLSKWPKEDDYVFVKMIEKHERLFAHIIGRKQLTDYNPNKEPLLENQVVNANVMYLLEHGLVCFTEDFHEIFVHRNNFRKKYRIGEAISPKIIIQNSKDEYTATLIEQKELMLEKDALYIIDYLNQHQGVMPYTDKTSPEIISKVFHMSKSAFKRALGSLYKTKKIKLDKEKTILNK